MDHKFDKNDLSEVEYSSFDNNFKSLYGLTTVVEDAIKLTIKKKKQTGFKKIN